MTPEFTVADESNRNAGIDETETDRLNQRADELGKLDAKIRWLEKVIQGFKVELKFERQFTASLKAKLSKLEIET